jgi:HNH endonuclease
MTQLTSIRLQELLDYDPISGIFKWKISRRCIKAGDVAGYKNANGYMIVMIGGKNYRSHRLAWLYMTGNWPREQIDHINCIRDDNRFINLREATQVENSRNTKIKACNTSGFKGVNWLASRNQWMVSIRTGYGQKTIGYFRTLNDARSAYRSAAKKYHGEFARFA